jgi:PhzF family phenazine biosynthesis protein
MKLPIFQIDAFTGKVFGGNPAAVVLLDEPLPDETLQAIAAENNLSETAFVLRRGAVIELRWFTPQVEVDLCGHATLATAHVLFSEGHARGEEVRFETQSGALTVRRSGNLLCMDFPARPPEPAAFGPELGAALGAEPREVLAARDLLVLLDTEADVAALRPDFVRVAALEVFAIIVTAPGREVDFVSRFFAPQVGIPEDPVTGSAHCTLIPFWAERLGKDEMRARQISRRGGEIFCQNRGARVTISGRAVEFLRGEISF